MHGTDKPRLRVVEDDVFFFFCFLLSFSPLVIVCIVVPSNRWWIRVDRSYGKLGATYRNVSYNLRMEKCSFSSSFFSAFSPFVLSDRLEVVGVVTVNASVAFFFLDDSPFLLERK
jgi:hypothetical protein